MSIYKTLVCEILPEERVKLDKEDTVFVLMISDRINRQKKNVRKGVHVTL